MSRPAHLAGRRAQRWSRVAGGQRRVSGGLPLTGVSTAAHSAPLGRTKGIGLSVNPQPQGDRPPHRRKARTQATHVKQRGALLLLPSPYQGHGSLRGRTDPPQHLVRSTGAAMSTTGLRDVHVAQRLPSQPPAPSPRRATITSGATLRMDLGEGASNRRWLLGPAEGLARTPYAVHDHSEFPGKRHACLASA